MNSNKNPIDFDAEIGYSPDWDEDSIPKRAPEYYYLEQQVRDFIDNFSQKNLLLKKLLTR